MRPKRFTSTSSASSSQLRDRDVQYIKRAVIDSIARHIRKWDVTIHDFRGFSDDELQVFMNGDKVSEDGVTLAKPGSGRLSVIEAFRAARNFYSMPPREAPPGGSRTPPRSGFPRAGSENKRRRSRRRSSSRSSTQGVQPPQQQERPGLRPPEYQEAEGDARVHHRPREERD